MIAWLASIVVIVTYFTFSRTGRATPFHVANVFGAVVLGRINLAHGSYPQAVLNVLFGAVAASALWALIREHRQVERQGRTFYREVHRSNREWILRALQKEQES
jgi:hypothetical protein